MGIGSHLGLQSRRGGAGAGGRRNARQLALSFPNTWGGARAGAGRKRAERGNVAHRARPAQRATEPVHVTLRARVAPLRSQHVFPTVRLALLRAGRRDPERFRVLQFSVQHDHVHLIVEAKDKRALSSGVRSVAIRIARYVNDLLGRRGRLWADRWHGRALRTPREVRNALVYVLANFRKHARDATGKGRGACAQVRRRTSPGRCFVEPNQPMSPPSHASEPAPRFRHDPRRGFVARRRFTPGVAPCGPAIQVHP